MIKRIIIFVLVNIALFIIFLDPVSRLISMSLNSDLYSYMLLVPFVSMYFFYSDRKKIFKGCEYSFLPGIVLMAIGGSIFFLGYTQAVKLTQDDYFSLIVLGAMILWVGSFVFFLGAKTIRNSYFPVIFLVFLVPIPSIILDRLILVLQHASTEVSYVILKLTGVPLYREGFIFHLPGVSVEVAKECSGIRSTIVLFITSILAGRLFLKTTWKKAVLALSIFPIAVFKNGVRIVTLSLLGAYVDMRYLTESPLHRNGGVVFFILALLLLSPVLWILRKSEREPEGDKTQGGGI